jgi:hypothetical protein
MYLLSNNKKIHVSQNYSVHVYAWDKNLIFHQIQYAGLKFPAVLRLDSFLVEYLFKM